jgi:hypothetical protein
MSWLPSSRTPTSFKTGSSHIAARLAVALLLDQAAQYCLARMVGPAGAAVAEEGGRKA